MMQLLHAGGLTALVDGERPADIDNPRGYFEFERVKKTKTDSSWLEDARGKVVKMVHMLLLDLPLDGDKQYRVVMMRREMSEVLASQSKMLQRLGRGGAAIGDAQLAAVFTQQLKKVYDFIATHPQNFHMLEVSYNALLADPSGLATKINAFVGGGLDEAKMGTAVDPSLYRNRRS